MRNEKKGPWGAIGPLDRSEEVKVGRRQGTMHATRAPRRPAAPRSPRPAGDPPERIISIKSIKKLDKQELSVSRHRPGGGMHSIAATASIAAAPLRRRLGIGAMCASRDRAPPRLVGGGGHVTARAGRGRRRRRPRERGPVAAWQRARSYRARPRHEPARHAARGGAVHRAAGAAPPARWVQPPAPRPPRSWPWTRAPPGARGERPSKQRKPEIQPVGVAPRPRDSSPDLRGRRRRAGERADVEPRPRMTHRAVSWSPRVRRRGGCTRSPLHFVQPRLNISLGQFLSRPCV